MHYTLHRQWKALRAIEFSPRILSGLECEGHPEMMKGVAAHPLYSQRSLKGWDEALQRLHRHTGDNAERERVVLPGPCTVHQATRGPSCLGGIVDHKSG